MVNLWFISDLHLGHENIITFKNYDGSLMRPFDTIEKMHQCIFDRWNETVKPGDKIYVLGDLAFGKRGMEVLHSMQKLPGRKRAVLGNHDRFHHMVYGQVFQEIFGLRQINGLWASHAPLHPASIRGRNAIGNVHGHLHNNIVGEPGYRNVCCERVQFTPINYDEVVRNIEDGGLY